MRALRFLVVADDPLARAGLATLLAQQPDCTVVGQMADDRVVLASLPLYQPEVIVWDLGWEAPHRPGQSPRTALHALAEQLSNIHEAGYKLLVLLSDESQVMPLWTAGVRGLLLRHSIASALAAALHAVAQGLTVLDAALTQTLFPPRDVAASGEALTPREHEVLRLVAEGLPNKTIAARLHISEHTVKFHLTALMSKLGAQSRTEVVVRATRLGLLLL